VRARCGDGEIRRRKERNCASLKVKNDKHIVQLDEAKVFPKRIVTELSPLKGFYRAEDYHQDYALKNPTSSYIQICYLPRFSALKKQFPELFVNYKGK